MEKTAIENRIALLRTRSTSNGNIIRKLQRRLRKLEKVS